MTLDFAHWCRVGEHSFTLEQTNLAEVAAALGAGTIVRDGAPGAANFQWLVRYQWRDKVVTFSSNNDMGGPDHQLEEVDIEPIAGTPDEANLPRIEGDIRFPFGPAGMTLAELQKKLGDANVNASWAEYDFTGHKPSTDSFGKPMELDVWGVLRIQVQDDQITQLQVSRVTSS